MGITYDKKLIKKDRAISPTGPRDHQRRKSSGGTIDSTLVEALKAQIEDLQGRLNNGSGWTDEKVNDEIEKAISSEIRVVKSEYESLTSIQRDKIASLEENIKSFKDSRLRDAEIMEQLRNENSKLKSENSALKEKISSKDELITQLKETETTQLSEEKLAEIISAATKNIQINTSTEEVVDTSRPQMETVFVDPTENESKAESHIVVEDISTTEKAEINNKLDKLKGLMGKLPSKKL